MRALKKGKYGTVQYVSDNYTVRNKDLVSKHVFAGNTRLVSKVVMNEEKSGKMVATEQGSYYYHADHLGSSSVVTDKAGKFYEHLEYFPYGETWVHNKATAGQESTPYKFTSKELDEETGLYYFGIRTYDSKLSRWISADPPISQGRYFPEPPISDEAKEGNSKLPGMGGVFNSINLDAYQYAGQNPVKLIDPDGNQIFDNGEINFIRAITNGDNKMVSHYAGVIADGLGYSSAVSYSAGFDAGLLRAFTGLNPGPKSSGIKESEYHDNFNTGKVIGEKTGAVLRTIGGAKVVSGVFNYLVKNPA